MSDRSGLRDFALFSLIVLVLILQAAIMAQRDHESRRLVEEVRDSQRATARLAESLATTNANLRDLTSVLVESAKSAGGNAAATGAIGLSQETAAKLAATAQAATEQKPQGDELVWGFFGTEPSTINPLVGRDMYARYIARDNRIFEYLTSRDRDTGAWKGVLAESWTIADDGLSITYKLRPQARWSDGTPLTAADVVFSIRLALNPRCDCPNLRSYLNKLDPQRPVEALDEHTVRFRMAEKYFAIVGGTGNIVPIMPRHVYEPFATEDAEGLAFNRVTGKKPGDPIVGSGPYRFESWTTGREITLVRNESYWGAKPALDRIRVRMYLNPQGAIQDLLKGEVDFLLDPPSENYYPLSIDPNNKDRFHFLLWDSYESGFRYIGYNMRRDLFADARVRRALTMLLDREQLLRELDFNYGRVAVGYFWGAGPQADPTVKPWPYDLDAARRLLAEAGWTPGLDGILTRNGVPFRFKFQVSSGLAYYEKLGRYFKNQCAKVGIDLQIEYFEWATYSQKLTERDFEVCCLGWGGGDIEADPYQIWHSSEADNRGSNYVGFKNSEADDCIEKGRRELDNTRRNAYFHRFSRILHDQQPYTFLTQRFSKAIVAKRFVVTQHKYGIDPLDWYVPTDQQLRGRK